MLKRALKKTLNAIWDTIVFGTIMYSFVILIKMPLDMWREHFADKRRRNNLTENYTV